MRVSGILFQTFHGALGQPTHSGSFPARLIAVLRAPAYTTCLARGSTWTSTFSLGLRKNSKSNGLLHVSLLTRQTLMKASSEHHVVQPRTGADAVQLLLLRRFGFQVRLTASVRLLSR